MPAIVSPIDGQIAFTYENLDLEAALQRLARAEAAQEAWARTTIAERAKVLLGMLDRYGAHLDAHAAKITRMMGKPIGQARGEFSGGFTQRTRHLCEIAEGALADLEVADASTGIRRFVRRAPVGVVLTIAAWNYPLLVPINSIAAALLAGNSVLLKHAPQTALVADHLELAFREAGAPAGLVTALHVDHATAAALIHTRRLGQVSFTGSVRGGHEVYRAVAERNFIGVGLELGGKDPAIVLGDAPVEKAAAHLVDGAFYNAGQSCCAVERVYVHRSIYDRFVEAFVAEVHKYVVGDPLDPATTLGPVVNAAAAERIRDQADQAQAMGARRLTDDSRFHLPERSPCYLAPQVFDRVDHSMDLMREESFGPILGIMPFSSDDEAVALANDSAYGLTASVWTEDPARALAIAERLDAGTVFQNRCDYLDPALAWTGVKDSGHGAALGALGIQGMTRPKSFHLRGHAP
ncbi:MAG: aldehyde dehydrogenase family protein [Nannocystaceae bacterium]